MNKMIGPWAFILGLVIAVIAGLLSLSDPIFAWVIVLLGLVAGLLNVTDKELNMFLLAGIGFIVGAKYLGDFLTTSVGMLSGDLAVRIGLMFSYIVLFVAPAVALVGIKALYDITQN